MELLKVRRCSFSAIWHTAACGPIRCESLFPAWGQIALLRSPYPVARRKASLARGIFSDLNEAVRGVDAVMCLRLQLERQQAGLLPDLRDYSARYCLTMRHLELANPGVRVLQSRPHEPGA